MQRSVWDQDCRSWYKNAQGKITAVWAGSAVHYIETLERPRFEDYDWKYQTPASRWSFLGNGFSQREHLGADLGWYIRQRDDATPLGKKERFAFAPSGGGLQDVAVLPDSAPARVTGKNLYLEANL